MPNQVSNSVRLILKPFLFDYNEKSNERPVPPGATFCATLRTTPAETRNTPDFQHSQSYVSPKEMKSRKWRKPFFPRLRPLSLLLNG